MKEVGSPKLLFENLDLTPIQPILWRAIEFHGHKGPMMVVGLRMGLTALRLLDASGWFDLRCRVFTRWIHQDSCVVDGIQVATGCTMGKRNIEVVDREGISAEFTTDKGRIRLRLKQRLLDRIRETLSLADEEATRALLDEIIAANDRILFETF